MSADEKSEEGSPVKPPSPLKRCSTEPISHSGRANKRPRTEERASTGGKWAPATPETNGTPPIRTPHSTGGKNGPKFPLPVLEDSPRERPRLYIPKVSSFDELKTPDLETNQILVRLESATPNKPLFIDNDPSFGLDLPIGDNSPVPFPPSRQNSCNSLVKFSEKLFEDNQAQSDDSLSLPDINDRIPLARSPGSLSASSDSSGIQMRLPTPASEGSHCSDGFTVNNQDNDSKTNDTESSSKLSENSCESTQPLEEGSPSQSGQFSISDFRNEPPAKDDAIPSTSKDYPALTKSKIEQDTDLMFQQVEQLQEQFAARGLEVDPNDIFMALERYRVADNRLQLVFEELINRNVEISLQNELHELQARFHDLDTTLLHTLLEIHKNTEDRKEKVISLIMDNASLVHDPIFLDLIHLMRIFPDRDKMEIYAYLKSKQELANRTDVVAELLLQNRQETLKTNESLMLGESQTEFVDEVDQLKSVFPDADREYLFEQLQMRKDDPKRRENLASRMAELSNYTKATERPKKGKRRKAKFVLKDFVKTFPKALEYFHQQDRVTNATYKRHTRVYLLNYFTSITDHYIDQVLNRHAGLLTPAFKAIRESVDLLSRQTPVGAYDDFGVGVFAEEPRTQALPYPDTTDELFTKEVQFLEHEGEVTNYITMLAKEKQRAKDSARASGELMECQCCYDDEVLFEDMMACEDGHLFCVECIRMSSETAIGEGKSTFRCLSENCESQFPLTVLKQILKPEILTKALQRLQSEEIRLAGIENLVNCPFCPFATIMDDPTDKVFRCQNPECLKESCRFCRETNHLPLTCEEAQKDCTDMRTFVEKRVSEAMIRVCHSCGYRFYKHDGCNKMTCQCGASMCYVCRAPDIEYEHFGDGADSCHLYQDCVALHRHEMDAAGRRACEEYVKLHPEAAGKFDYEELMKGVPEQQYDEDEEEEEEEYDDDDDDEEEMEYDG